MVEETADNTTPNADVCGRVNIDGRYVGLLVVISHVL